MGKLSGTVLLTHRKRTVLSRSYGKANERKSLPNRSDTIFAPASVAKLFTATAIMQQQLGLLHPRRDRAGSVRPVLLQLRYASTSSTPPACRARTTTPARSSSPTTTSPTRTRPRPRAGGSTPGN
ncbi:serine hydrolase [Nonomuraea rubra]